MDEFARARTATLEAMTGDAASRVAAYYDPDTNFRVGDAGYIAEQPACAEKRKVVDQPLVPDGDYGNVRPNEPRRVPFALVADLVQFGGDDNGWRQPREITAQRIDAGMFAVDGRRRVGISEEAHLVAEAEGVTSLRPRVSGSPITAAQRESVTARDGDGGKVRRRRRLWLPPSSPLVRSSRPVAWRLRRWSWRAATSPMVYLGPSDFRCN